MKKTEMNEFNNESPIDVINSGYDFNWFGDDLYENFVEEETPIESMNNEKLDTAKIDELVDLEDYMWFQDYLDTLDDEKKHEALEYVENNYPEFMKDEEWNLFEPMKSNTGTKENLAKNLDNKPSFDKRDIQDELWDALLESYKNAA